MKSNSKGLKIWGLVLLAGITMSNVKSDHGKYFEISKNIEIFTNLYKEINTYYVDDLDPAKLMRTGVDAMLESFVKSTIMLPLSSLTTIVQLKKQD